MLLFGFLLVPIVLAAKSELKINNYIVNIDENTLKSIQTTKESASNELNLSSLGLRGIDKNAFDNLEYVRNLNLANNSLSSLPEFVFANLTNLEHLSLAGNEIDGFANTFVGLNNLKTLNISKNPLKHLRKSFFFGLTKSSDILTLGNKFWTIDTELFENPFLRNEQLGQDLTEEEVKPAKEESPVVNNEKASKPVHTSRALDKNLRVKICIQDGSVKLVDVLKKDETLASDCHEVKINHESGELSLQKLGITKFESGWYRLQGLAIHTIGLEENNIVRVTSELLNGLPEEVTYVILSDNKIERLEKGIIENEHLRRLNLKGNAISEIEDGALEKTKLTGLYIFSNRLKSTKFVATLPSTLTSLILLDNQIVEVTAGSFAKLNQLEYVNLAGNNITELKSQSLRGLSSLQALQLEGSGLKKIESGAFQDLKALTILHLNHNNLESLEKGVFTGLEKIEKIYASNNKLTKITKDSLEGLPESFEQLSLSFNAIESLKAGTFVNVPKHMLSLQGNKISKIEKGSFDLSTLHELDLSENLLNDLDGDSFEGLRSLRHLSLKDNGIKKIEKGTAKNLGSLYTLDISNNPIKRLENGGFFGLQKSRGSHIRLTDVPVELIQGGLFEDV